MPTRSRRGAWPLSCELCPRAGKAGLSPWGSPSAVTPSDVAEQRQGEPAGRVKPAPIPCRWWEESGVWSRVEFEFAWSGVCRNGSLMSSVCDPGEARCPLDPSQQEKDTSILGGACLQYVSFNLLRTQRFSEHFHVTDRETRITQDHPAYGERGTQVPSTKAHSFCPTGVWL